EYKSATEAAEAPLAQALFQAFPFVTEVFFDNDYISVTKTDTANWEEESPRLRAFIKDYLVAEKTVINTAEVKKWQAAAQAHLLSKVTTDPISQQIVAIIEEHVKPAVASDGGNIQFISYQPDTHHVEVLLQGACSGCPSSTQTLKKGIEAILKNKLGNPDINVEAI
uniref:NifU family protein n=1 Tax=Capnocytophaga leadbetteri TaxID=327575 RepID=UPI0028E47A71